MNDKPAFVPHYRMLMAGLGVSGIDETTATTAVDTGFLRFLVQEFARQMPLDAAFYERQSAVAEIAGGEAQDHFARAGFEAGLLPRRLLFDAEYYAAQNPDLAALRQEGGAVALAAHFLQFGRHEGRAAHPEAQRDAERWTRAVARTGHELAHRSFHGALVQSFLPPLLGPRGRGFRGGVVLGDTPEEELLRHRRANRSVDTFPPREDAPVGTLAGEYVYGGPYCDHFGHAMAEMIHRVLPSRALFDCRRLLFVGQQSKHPPRGFEALPIAMQAPLRFLGVDPADVTVINDTRVVERLHVAQQGSDLTAGPRDSYLAMLAAYTPARLAALHDDSRAAAKVYVSRSRVIHGGLLLGEAYLEHQLQREGWRVLHPQELPLVGQMQAYFRAETLIFAEGSACHGAELFGTGGLGHCLLLPRRATSLHVFDSALRPRARRFDTLPAGTLLGSTLADPATGIGMDNQGISVLNLAELAPAMRALGVAALPDIDPAAYREIALADLDFHIAHHRREGTRLVDDAALAALRRRCSAALPKTGKARSRRPVPLAP